MFDPSIVVATSVLLYPEIFDSSAVCGQDPIIIPIMRPAIYIIATLSFLAEKQRTSDCKLYHQSQREATHIRSRG